MHPISPTIARRYFGSALAAFRPALLGVCVALVYGASTLPNVALAKDVELAAPRPATARAGDGNRELVLSFPKPVEAAPFEAMARANADLIEFVNVGYDSVLIRFTGPMVFSLRYQETSFTLSLDPQKGGTSANNDDGNTRVEVQLARIELAEGNSRAALQRLRNVEKLAPDDTDTKAVLADAADSVGLWRQGRLLRSSALALRPFDESLQEAQNRSAREFGPRLRLESDALWVQKNYRQFISLLSVNALPGPRTEIGAIVENRQLQTDRGITLQGQTIYFTGARQRADIYAEQEHDDDSSTRGSLLAGPATMGGALSHMRRDLGGLTRIKVEYQKPFFDVVSGIINHATRDSAELRHEVRFLSNFSAFAGTQISRYGVDTHSDVSRTMSGTTGLRYGRDFSGLFGSLGYTMEGEYLLNEHKLQDIRGIDFRALPMVDRELHALDMTLSQEIITALRYDMQIGYGMNRFGSEGAFASMGLAYGPNEWPVEVGLRGSWSRFARFGEAGDLTRAGGYMTWRF